jgi:nucleotide-binding universal stress UspA family protein
VKLLTWLARRFHWKSHTKTLASVPDADVEDAVCDAVVVFLHAERRDTEPEARQRAFRHALKHVKWLAGKRGFERVVLHSFTHLGADDADPELARAFLEDLAERLRATGYDVRLTPFGYSCEWELAVYGESLAKVWKEL